MKRSTANANVGVLLARRLDARIASIEEKFLEVVAFAGTAIHGYKWNPSSIGGWGSASAGERREARKRLRQARIDLRALIEESSRDELLEKQFKKHRRYGLIMGEVRRAPRPPSSTKIKSSSGRDGD